MYWKLAAGNVKKSYREYGVYFVTLAFSVCLFYIFHSFDAQQNALRFNEYQKAILKDMALIMEILSVFVAAIFGFLILYASRFLIKRRKKELGLYLLLGMRKWQVSKILIAETVLVGFCSLVAGLFAGLLFSQLMLYGTVRFWGTGGSLEFLFSVSAVLKTVGSFAMIFCVVLLFYMRVLKKHDLIDLWQAEHKNESPRLLNGAASVITMLLCVLTLSLCYCLANLPLTYFLQVLWPVVLLGALGTLLFFFSLSGFLMTVTRSSKQFYFKNLTMFVMRQITSKLHTTYWVMTFVCILQVLAIGAFAVGLGTSASLKQMVRQSTPFDYSYSLRQPSDSKVKAFSKLWNETEGVRESAEVTLFESDRKEQDILVDIAPKSNKSTDRMSPYKKVQVVSLTSLNQVLQMQGKSAVSLHSGEAYLFTGPENKLGALPKDAAAVISMYDREFRVVNREAPAIALETGTQQRAGLVIAVNDGEIPKNAKATWLIVSANLEEGIRPSEFSETLSARMDRYNEQWGKKDNRRLSAHAGVTKEEAQSNGKEMEMVFTYVGFYLGTVFLICGAVVLALQQLSQASDNRERYRVLYKIGAPPKMCRQSILIQIALYFFLPLALAIVHSVAGIGMMNSLISAMGIGAIWSSALVTGGLVILIYGIYFVITYKSCNRILRQNGH